MRYTVVDLSVSSPATVGASQGLQVFGAQLYCPGAASPPRIRLEFSLSANTHLRSASMHPNPTRP